MLFRHPLENPSLAPLDLRTRLSHQRLQYKPHTQFWVYEERMMARVWEKRNRADALRPLPVETIIHKIMPSMARRNRLEAGDFVFEGKPYLTRDLVTLSSAVQWFGSNVGRSFLDTTLKHPGRGYHESKEFTVKLEREKRHHHDIYAFLAHRCTNKCGKKKKFQCVYPSDSANERDRAVIDALMRWLGTMAGRRYIADFRVRRDLALEAAHRRLGRYLDKRRAA